MSLFITSLLRTVIAQERRLNGIRRIVLDLGTEKFGPPDAEIQRRLRHLHDVQAVEALPRRTLSVSNWRELLPEATECCCSFLG
jgi:hypothetical protein